MSRVCLSPPTESKIHFCPLLLLSVIEGSGYGFGDNIQDVLLQKFVFGVLLMRFLAVVCEVSDFLAVVALPSFGLCLL